MQFAVVLPFILALAAATSVVPSKHGTFVTKKEVVGSSSATLVSTEKTKPPYRDVSSFMLTNS